MLEILSAMRRVEMIFMRAIRPIIQDQGLSKPEIIILFNIHHQNSFRMSEMAKVSDIPASTMTGLIDRLVARNYLERVNDPDDRRGVMLKGTPELDKIMTDIGSKMDEKVAEILKSVPKQLVQDAARNLECIYEYIKTDGAREENN